MKKLSIIILCFVLPVTKHHVCPFDLCPYKEQTAFKGVINTGETAIDKNAASDVYSLDSLHFVYPVYSYDELDSILNK